MSQSGKRARFLGLVMACAASAMAVPSVAQADEPVGAAPSWRARYERARARMVEGEYRAAEVELRALAEEATTEGERALAKEVADLAKAQADRLDVVPTTYVTPRPKPVRSSDELTLLYATSFLYGAGTGVWFLLLTQPDTAIAATLPFAAITAAPILAVATVDSIKKLPRGVPHAISAGTYLGLGEGVLLVAYQQARAARIEKEDPNSEVRLKPEGVASVLWGSATLGGIVGGVLGSSLVTTPGRVSFTASTTLWSGVLTGLAAGAIQRDNPYRSERAFAIGGIGYNAGLVGGMLGASAVSPSVTRVRIVDLLGAAGGLSSLGLYLSVAGDPNRRAGEGITALGAGTGLALGWLLTSGMSRELPRQGPAQTGVSVQPAVLPIAGGASLGVFGTL